MTAAEVYAGSDGEVTKWLYAELEKLGSIGVIAMNLFRAQKASARAKVYRGGNSKGRFKAQAYEKKEWSLRQLCEALEGGVRNSECGIAAWGWKEDPRQEFHKWVLYVELPTGQVSFHTSAPMRMAALDGGYRAYAGEWDGTHLSAERIVGFVDQVLHGEVVDVSKSSSAEALPTNGMTSRAPQAEEDLGNSQRSFDRPSAAQDDKLKQESFAL